MILYFVAFIRSKLPFDLLVPLDKETVEDFLGNWWRDNRLDLVLKFLVAKFNI